ncbi:MAG: restriction endonuclease subunit S [Chitinophagaceae bacterium]|nr:restriction endonuclease subunit S [Chitinophagaceae bacterium]
MSEWKEYRFSELLVDDSISYGIVQPGFHKEDGIPIIRVNNIKNGKIASEDVLKVSSDVESKYNRTRLEGGELLITVVGTVGECAIVPKELKGWNVARAVSVARIKEGINKQFIRYAFKTDDLIFQMYGNTNDTVQPTLNLSSLKDLKFSLPPLTEQTAIAEVLSSLDDKIALLHRQNKTLEQLAETLFRQWFVEEELNGTLGEYIKVQNGYAFKSKDFKEKGFAGVIKIRNISMGSIDITNHDCVDENVVKNLDIKFKIKTGDFLIAMTGAEIGKIGIIEKTEREIWLNQRVGKLEAKVPYGDLIGYLALKSREGQEHITNACAGSAQENISSAGIEEMNFVNYNKNKTEALGKEIQSLFEKNIFNQGQIKTLIQLRDTLLPKLMSGEVRVNQQTN